jgi:hypothetical protein
METNWLRTKKQLNFLERIWDKLDSDLSAIGLIPWRIGDDLVLFLPRPKQA